jgi:hypothetical protein
VGAEGLEVVEGVAAAGGDGGDVVDFEGEFGVGGGRAAAGGAAVAVTGEDFPADGEGDFAAGAFLSPSPSGGGAAALRGGGGYCFSVFYAASMCRCAIASRRLV